MMGDVTRVDSQALLGRIKEALGSRAAEYTEVFKSFMLARISRADFEHVARGLLKEENSM